MDTNDVNQQPSTFYYEVPEEVGVISDVVINQQPTDFDAIAVDANYFLTNETTRFTERERKFREEMKNRAPEYTDDREYRIFVATWNVNIQSSESLVLNEWLAAGEEPPDIYAIAFQELDMSARAITMSEAKPDINWTIKVMAGLHPPADQYELLASVRLVGMMLIVAVKRSIKEFIKCSVDSVGTGALNMLGNKGGVGISLVINKTTLCFVNSHLAAHQNEVERRKLDHDEILRRMTFTHGIRRFSIVEHDLVFWFGDLNYRLDETSDKIKDLVELKNYPELIKLDQLGKQRRLGLIFQGFSEGQIKFPPTYKYNPGTDEFDSSEKARAPAWCDRILWRGDVIKQHDYNSIMTIRVSDHKPIYSVFTAVIPSINIERKKKINEEILKSMDKRENDSQPQITVSETDINFDTIRFFEHHKRELILANNHHLPVMFSFRTKDKRPDSADMELNGGRRLPNPADEKICEDWVRISPTRGRLYAGQILNISIEIFVDAKSAAVLNKWTKTSRNPKIPNPLDILVLHVEYGRDTFISVLGDYVPSCFGFSMETLLAFPRPIASMELCEIQEFQTIQLRAKPSDHKVPKELFHLIDYLYKAGLDTPHLFTANREYSKNLIIMEIRDWLDQWSTNDFPGTPHTTAEALLMLLEGTPEPFLQAKERPLLENCTRFELCFNLIASLDVVKRTCFLYVCLFLREVRKHYATNRLHDDLLASLFGKIFFKNFDPRSSKIFIFNMLHNINFGEFARSHLLD